MKKFILSILIVFLMTFSVNAEIGTDGSIGKDPSSGSGSVATDTIFDAVGDLVQGSGSDTAARLAIGSAGTLLQSTGSAAAWATTLTGAYTFNKVNAASGSATVLQYTGTLGIMNGSDIFKLLAIDIINADHTGASNYVEGISIGSITGDADASEYGYYIGTGWDYGLWSGSNVFVRNGTSGGALHLGEGSGGGSNYIGLKAPDALAGDTVYTLPTAFPAGAGYLLNSGATGTMGFTDPATFQASGSYQADMGITAKSDSTSTTSSTSVASSTAVKAAYDLAALKLNTADPAYTGKLTGAAPTELTIATDAITVTQTFHTVDTQADAASDDLATISGFSDTQIIFLRASHTDRSVVLVETGNILIPYGTQITLDDTSRWVMLVYDANLTKWVVIGTLPDTIAIGALSSVPITFPEVDGHTDATNLTAAQVSRTVINSYGRAGAATLNLPAAAAGYTFIAIVGTKHNSTWKILRNGADTIYWDSGGVLTAGKTYFQETNQEVGSRCSCATFRTGAAAWSWICGSISGTWVTD